jgi:hypothetical protein
MAPPNWTRDATATGLNNGTNFASFAVDTETLLVSNNAWDTEFVLVEVLDNHPSVSESFSGSVPGTWTGTVRTVGHFPGPGSTVIGWAQDDNGYYIAVWDVSDNTAPTLLGKTSSLFDYEAESWQMGWYGAYADGVAVIPITSAPGGHAYQNSLVIVDVSTPTAPTVEGVVSRATLSPRTNSAWVRSLGSDLFVVAEDRTAVRGFDIIDVSTPSAPTVTGSLATAARLRQSIVIGDYLYATREASGVPGVDIYDLGAPATPTKVTTSWDPQGDDAQSSTHNIEAIIQWDAYLVIATHDSSNPYLFPV